MKVYRRAILETPRGRDVLTEQLQAEFLGNQEGF